MTALVSVTACCVAVVAAARSTWSPCGLSMLSTITPIGERGRGHRYVATASWFALGSLLGGACLGAACAGLAALYRTTGAPETVTLAVLVAAAVVCAASDSRVGGFELPIHRRQVNETWLDQYRPWVYGLGFGWQIGCGLATYIRTAAVYLLVVLGASSGSPLVAFAACAGFGLLRGLAVTLSRNATTPDALRELHRRLSSLEVPSRRVVVGCELLAAIALAAELSGVALVALVALITVGILASTVVGARRRAEPQSSMSSACSGQFSTASRAGFSLSSGTSATSTTQCP